MPTNDTGGSRSHVMTVATFSTARPGRVVKDGFAVYDNAMLFKCGDYKDKGFSMSPDEMRTAIESFQPVSGNIEHSNFLRGRACHVKSIKFDDNDPTLLRGEVHVPLGLDEIMEDGERRLSCEWDRQTKALSGLALVVNPRVKEASLISAFSSWVAEHPDSQPSADALFSQQDPAEFVQSILDNPDSLAPLLATFTARKHDEELSRSMQGIHDHIASRHPWACGPGMAKMSGASDQVPDALRAEFGDKPKQFKAIKDMHEMTKEHGATCSVKAQMSVDTDPNSHFRSDPERTVRMASVKETLMQAVGALPDKPSDNDIKNLVKAFGPDLLPKVASFAAAPAEDRFAKFADDPDFVAFKQAQDRRIAELEEKDRKAADAALFAESKSRAVAFCDARQLGGDHVANLTCLFHAAAKVDGAHSPKVTFSAAGTVREDGSLATALANFLNNLPSAGAPVPLDPDGRPDATNLKVLFNDPVKARDNEAASEEAHRRNLSYTETGRQILANMTKGN